MTLFPKLIPAIDRRAFAIMGNTMPPRDPDDDEEETTKRKTKTTKRKRTKPTNRRSCASRMKTRQGPYT